MIAPNRRLRILAVPLWYANKPRPARLAGLTFEASLLVELFRDMPKDTVFTGQDAVNIYTQSHDYVVTHPSFDEQDDQFEIPIVWPSWDNLRAAMMYS